MAIRKIVRAQIEPATSFEAEVELNLDKLDFSNMPAKLSGIFTAFRSDGDRLLLELLQGAEMSQSGYSPTLWFDGNGTGYRFRLTSERDFIGGRI